MFKLMTELRKLGVDEVQIAKAYEILGRLEAGEAVSAEELADAQRACLQLLRACNNARPRQASGCFY